MGPAVGFLIALAQRDASFTIIVVDEVGGDTAQYGEVGLHGQIVEDRVAIRAGGFL